MSVQNLNLTCHKVCNRANEVYKTLCGCFKATDYTQNKNRVMRFAKKNKIK